MRGVLRLSGEGDSPLSSKWIRKDSVVMDLLLSRVTFGVPPIGGPKGKERSYELKKSFTFATCSGFAEFHLEEDVTFFMDA